MVQQERLIDSRYPTTLSPILHNGDAKQPPPLSCRFASLSPAQVDLRQRAWLAGVPMNSHGTAVATAQPWKHHRGRGRTERFLTLSTAQPASLVATIPAAPTFASLCVATPERHFDCRGLIGLFP